MVQGKQENQENKENNCLLEPVLLPGTCANVTIYLPFCSQYLAVKLVALCMTFCTQMLHGWKMLSCLML